MQIDVGGYGLEVHVHPGQQPVQTIVFLHGFAGSHADWDGLLASLKPHWNVVTMDLLGHGASDTPAPDAFRFEAAADALVRVADELGLSAPVWAGYSFGARLLLFLALRHPERLSGLVLEGVHPGLANPRDRAARAKQDQVDADLLEQSGVDAFLEKWYQLEVFETRRVRAGWTEEAARRRTTNRPVGLARCLRGLGLGAQPPLLDLVGRISIPVLLVAGLLDPPHIDSARQMHQRIPGSKLALVPFAGHGVHVEDSDAYLRALTGFLSTLNPVPTPSLSPRGA